MSDFNDTESDGDVENGQRMSPDYLANSVCSLLKESQLEAMIKELKEENSSLKEKTFQLQAENKKLTEEAGHIHWHIGVYHRTLEKLSNTTLAIYHETFREFRDQSSECAQCMNVRLLKKIGELENEVKVLKRGYPTSPVLGGTSKKWKTSRKRDSHQ